MASTSASASRKRKRPDSSAQDELTFSVAESSNTGALGPVLVSFPALKAPQSTTFKCYAENGKLNPAKSQIVVGETPDIEFVTNAGETSRASSSGCHYLLAVRDPRTSTLKIIPSRKSPHILGRQVKKLKSLSSGTAPTTVVFREAKNKLGETFGTKKAQAAIRAAERNRVDVNAMEGVMSHLMSGIEKSSGGLLTAEQAKEVEDSNRLIPPFNATTTDPDDIYPQQNIASDSEWRAIDIPQLTNPKEIYKHLPSAKFSWIQFHVERLDASKPSKKKWKILYYVSALFTFRRVMGSRREAMEKDVIHKKMGNVSTVIVDGMLSRFTEASRNSEGHTFTTGMETKLLSYMFALCLRADINMSDTEALAKDLSLPASRTQEIFKGLGCKIKKPTDRQLSSLGLGKDLQSTKMAFLKAPVEFPKVTGKKARR